MKPGRILLWGVVCIFLTEGLARGEQHAESIEVPARGEGGESGGQGTAFDEATSQHLQGLALADTESWEEALSHFDEALRLYPMSQSLLNRAVCLDRLGRHPTALAAFREYLERYGTEVGEDRRAAVEAAIRRLEGLVLQVRVRVQRPESAEVFLDGVAVGRTPLAGPLAVEPGPHTIEVRAEGFETEQYEISPEGEREVEVLVVLNPTGEVGTILIGVGVPGATVSLDGDVVGETPMDDPLIVRAGRHVVEVARHGYESARVEVALANGEVERIDLRLSQLASLPDELSGTLDVQVDEEDATVLVDGQALPLEGTLPVGPHRVEVRRDGFETWSALVEVTATGPTRVAVTLTPTADFWTRYESRARAFRRAAYATGGIGIALLGTALGLTIWNMARFQDWQEEDDDLREGHLSEDERAPLRLAHNEQGSSINAVNVADWVLLGTGVAAVAVAVGLFFGGPRPNRYPAVSLLPGPRGLALALAW